MQMMLTNAIGLRLYAYICSKNGGGSGASGETINIIEFNSTSVVLVQTVLHSFKELFDVMKMRTFYKQNLIFGKNKRPLGGGGRGDTV